MIAQSSGNDSCVDELQLTLGVLAACIDRAVGRYGSPVELGPMRAYRADAPTPPEDGVLAPVICIVAQGEKEVVVGREHHVYGAGHCLVNSIPVPATGRTRVASSDRPCLWLSIRIDPEIAMSVIEESRFEETRPARPLHTAEASAMDLSLTRAALKLAWLLDGPGDGNYLAQLAIREIVYRLLCTDQATHVRQIAAHAGGSSRVAQAIQWVRDHFDEPLLVEHLAHQFGMSPSVLHLRFKQVTALSPLQFQKQLRLQEAKRLIASDGLNAATAGTRVGYQNPSHFSRDYRRFFGDSPRRHVTRLRGEALGVSPGERPHSADVVGI